MDPEKIEAFLTLLEASEGDWLEAFADAGRRGLGVEGDVSTVLRALNIEDVDAETMFQHLPGDPASLAAYLRPRLLNTPG